MLPILIALDEKTVREIFSKKAEFLSHWHRFETPRCLGIDELHLNRRAVQTVLPLARIVVDKFHVVRMANEAQEKVRKGLRTDLKPNQWRTLKGDRKTLLKRAHDVSDRERLIMKTWTRAFPKLLAAYEYKERFYHIWGSTTRRDAEKALARWIDDIPQGQKEVSKDLVSAVSGWHEEVLAYFETDTPITNAFTESINRLAKDKNRDGRGYSFEVMSARMLYTTKHKKKSPQTKESPFLGKATMTYSMDLLEPEKNFGVDLPTFEMD